MNWKKTFALAALALSLPVLACQYSWEAPDVPPPPSEDFLPQTDYGARHISRRFLYLAGVNEPANHISGIYTDGESIRFTAANHMTLQPPFTVYVGAADVFARTFLSEHSDDGKQGSEMETVTVTVQYRVLPDSEWADAATKKFSAGDVKLFAAKKIFGKIKVDPPAMAGSKVLIRLHVTVDALQYPVLTTKTTGTMIGNTNPREDVRTAQYVENADPTETAVSTGTEISASAAVKRIFAGTAHATTGSGEEYDVQVIDSGLNLSLNILTAAAVTPGEQVVGGSSGAVYGGGWTDQYLMCFTVGDKRRPE